MKKQRRTRCYSYRLWRRRLKRAIVLLALIAHLLVLMLKIWTLIQG